MHTPQANIVQEQAQVPIARRIHRGGDCFDEQLFQHDVFGIAEWLADALGKRNAPFFLINLYIIQAGRAAKQLAVISRSVSKALPLMDTAPQRCRYNRAAGHGVKSMSGGCSFKTVMAAVIFLWESFRGIFFLISRFFAHYICEKCKTRHTAERI